MIRSFRSEELRLLFETGRELQKKTIVAQSILDVLDVINIAAVPQDAAFIGFRYDEWSEDNQPRYGVMISDHWLISYGWSDGHAIDVDLERLE
jgi:toxin HigB-1